MQDNRNKAFEAIALIKDPVAVCRLAVKTNADGNLYVDKEMSEGVLWTSGALDLTDDSYKQELDAIAAFAAQVKEAGNYSVHFQLELRPPVGDNPPYYTFNNPFVLKFETWE